MTPKSRWPLALLPIAVAACSSAAVPPPVVSAPATPPPAHVAPADAEFASAAAQSGLFANQISQIAAQKAGRQGIRDFAQTVVETQTQTANQLSGIMQLKGLEFPQSLSPAQAQTLESLNNAPPGRRFARTYFSALVRSQLGSLRQMESYARNGTDPELKSFAEAQVPVLRDQLARARRVPRERGAGA